MLAVLDDYIQKISAATDLDAIYGVLTDCLNSIGLSKFTYVILRAPEGMADDFWMSTYPMGWVEHYLNNEYDKNDPIFMHAGSTVLPFRWDTLTSQLSNKIKRPLDEATEFGINNGITIPVRGPGRCYAAFSFTSQTVGHEFDRIWGEYHHVLHIFALHTHEVIINTVYKSPRPSGIALYPRERECLLWTSRGKTAWEIGQILHLQEESVATYLKSATKKLGVNNKQHAVVKAILLGIIIP